LVLSKFASSRTTARERKEFSSEEVRDSIGWRIGQLPSGGSQGPLTIRATETNSSGEIRVAGETGNLYAEQSQIG